MEMDFILLFNHGPFGLIFVHSNEVLPRLPKEVIFFDQTMTNCFTRISPSIVTRNFRASQKRLCALFFLREPFAARLVLSSKPYSQSFSYETLVASRKEKAPLESSYSLLAGLRCTRGRLYDDILPQTLQVLWNV